MLSLFVKVVYSSYCLASFVSFYQHSTLLLFYYFHHNSYDNYVIQAIYVIHSMIDGSSYTGKQVNRIFACINYSEASCSFSVEFHTFNIIRFLLVYYKE